jgi:hypothetical protein
MDIDIFGSVFDECKGGTTHKRDGKGGAVSVGGGLQTDLPPENEVMVSNCLVNACEASGNGGGLYVTIRGKLMVVDTIITDCSALDEAKIRKSLDSRMTEGMGGGIHATAGGYFYIQEGGLTGVGIYNNYAAVSGGGLSIKSGKAFVLGRLSVIGNKANGWAADYFGNGGGIFVTTSYYDDSPLIGAGWGASVLWNEMGYITNSLSSDVKIANNTANRWGGGVYAGISRPWHEVLPPPEPKHFAEAKVVFKNAMIKDNKALFPNRTTMLWYPAQVAGERVGGAGAVLDFSGASISGNFKYDIGIYTWDSIAPVTVGTIFGPLAINTCAEFP